MKLLLFFCILTFSASTLKADFLQSRYSKKSDSLAISTQALAFNSNAGGQNAYALRVASKNKYELSLFSNQFLQVNSLPLTGVILSQRIPWCHQKCLLPSFIQVGGGFSTGGMVAELIWGFQLLKVIRLDFATHFYTTNEHTLIWSYPFWLGITVAF